MKLKPRNEKSKYQKYVCLYTTVCANHCITIVRHLVIIFLSNTEIHEIQPSMFIPINKNDNYIISVEQISTTRKGHTSLNPTNCSLLIFQLFLQLGIFFLHLIELFTVGDIKLVLPSKVYLLLTILLEGNLPTIHESVQCFLHGRLFEIELLQRVSHILRIQWPVLLEQREIRVVLEKAAFKQQIKLEYFIFIYTICPTKNIYKMKSKWFPVIYNYFLKEENKRKTELKKEFISLVFYIFSQWKT